MKLWERVAIRRLDPRETARTLDRAGAVLAGLNRSGEREFLAVLGRLRDFQIRTLAIVSDSAALFDVSSDEGWMRLKRDLPLLLGEAASSHGAGRALGPLAEAERGLRILEQRAEDLLAPVRLLRVLSVTTRIESERLGRGGADFEGLAAEVGRLSGDLDEKASRIGETCSAARRAVSRAVKTADAAGRAERESLRAMMAQAKESLGHLALSERETADLLAGLKGEFGKVSAELADLAGSSQYQDIARQRIEHIAEALKESERKLRGGESGARSQAAANAKLQGDQFASCWEDFSAARARMAGALGRIAERAAAMAAETSRLLESGGGAENGFFSAAAAECGSLAGAVKRNGELRGSVREAARGVAGAIGPMREFISQIEEIGERMRRISLNAHVKASRLAEQGAALSSVADAIQKTAVESAGRALSVVEAINALGGAADALGEAGTRESGSGDRLAGELERAAAHLNQREAEARSRIPRILDSASALASDLRAAAQGLGVRGEEADAVGKCLDELRAIGRHSSGGAGLGHLSRRYTMESERRVHGVKPPGAGAARSSVPQALPPQPLTLENARGNVELF